MWNLQPTLPPAALTLLVLVCLSSPADAVDGVLEINQTCAVNTGCFSGDAAGFPVTITRTGSYRLTSDLFVIIATITGIQVTTDHVNIDLNGFSILCSLPGLACGGGAGGIGVDASQASNLSVINGTIAGMGGTGISAGANARIERVSVIENGGDGILVENLSIVTDNMVTGNNGDGIHVFGIACTITGNAISLSNGDGIDVGANCTVIGNTSTFNTGYGLRTGFTGYVHNVFNNNNGGNTNPQVSSGIEMGMNICGADTTCP